MKQLIIVAGLLVATAASISAQNTFPSSGNVGIGTTSPTVRKLQLYDTASNVSTGIMVESAGTAGLENADLLLKTTGRLWQITNGKVNPTNGFAIVDVTAGAARLAIDTSGNVGIGTITPSSRLHIVGSVMLENGFGNPNAEAAYRLKFYDNGGIYNDAGIGLDGAANGSEKMWFNALNGFYFNFGTGGQKITFDPNGNVGIGTTSPGGKLQVTSADVGAVKTYSTTNGFGLILDQYYSAAAEVGAAWTRTADIVASTGDVSSSQIRFLTKPANLNPGVAMVIGGTGNVGIGTTNPTQKLSVNGTIRAKEVIVDTGWSDYVFASDYTLASLSEVEAHIKEHHTLPGVPSEAQVVKEGISVGEMQAKLLAKIEELTLHQIAQEKQIREQATRFAAQEGQLANQSARLERLETENAALRTGRP